MPSQFTSAPWPLTSPTPASPPYRLAPPSTALTLRILPASLAQAVHSLVFSGGHIGYGLLVVRLFKFFVLLSVSCVLRHFISVLSFVFVVGPLLFSIVFVTPF